MRIDIIKKIFWHIGSLEDVKLRLQDIESLSNYSVNLL